jgi:type IV secretory pathway VirJ component
LIRRHRVIAAALSLALGVVPLAHATNAGVTGAAKTMPAHAAKKSTKPKPHKAPLRDPQVDRWINVAGFGEVAVYKPKVASRGLALFASGDGGWNLGVTDMAHQAAAQGFWVAGFSTPQFLKGLDSTEAACSDADGLLAKLGTDLVRLLNLPLDTRPVIIGYSSGATIAYAALAADAGQRFGGGISLGFCPDLLIRKPFCAGHGGLTQQKQKQQPFSYVFDKHETVNVRWRILQGEIDRVCDPKFAAEFAAGQKDSKAVILPHVGHGFGAPKNWMPQYIQSVKDLAGSAH